MDNPWTFHPWDCIWDSRPDWSVTKSFCPLMWEAPKVKWESWSQPSCFRTVFPNHKTTANEQSLQRYTPKTHASKKKEKGKRYKPILMTYESQKYTTPVKSCYKTYALKKKRACGYFITCPFNVYIVISAFVMTCKMLTRKNGKSTQLLKQQNHYNRNNNHYNRNKA